MCGIVGFFSKDSKIKIIDIFKIAYLNRHRGNEDGFGLIYLENGSLRIKKRLLFIEEIISGKVKIGARKDIKIKNVENVDEYYQKELDEFKEVLSKDTNLCILHHRKASSGGVSIKNTHPFSLKKNVFYIHNGSLFDYTSLKNYIFLNSEIKFKSDTDSELLSYVLEEFLESWKDENDPSIFKAASEYLDSIFFAYGLLLRYNYNSNMIDIFSSNDRSFYIYKSNNENKEKIFFMSEPIVTKTAKYDSVIHHTGGHIRLDVKNMLINNDNASIIDFTERLKHCSEILTKSTKVKLTLIKCDSCGIEKYCLGRIRLKTTENNFDIQDICPDCLMANSLRGKKKLADDWKYDFSYENKKIEYQKPTHKNSYGSSNFNHEQIPECVQSCLKIVTEGKSACHSCEKALMNIQQYGYADDENYSD